MVAGPPKMSFSHCRARPKPARARARPAKRARHAQQPTPRKRAKPAAKLPLGVFKETATRLLEGANELKRIHVDDDALELAYTKVSAAVDARFEQAVKRMREAGRAELLSSDFHKR